MRISTLMSLWFMMTTLQYGMVIDAGSSHTGMYVYKWSGEKTPHATEGTGIVTEFDHCKTKGGIAAQGYDDPKSIAAYLDVCFTQLMKRLSKLTASSSQSTVPVFFAATAGMRVLNATDSVKTANILKSVHHYVSTYALDTKTHPGLKAMVASSELVSIISGVHEGFYSWVGANYLTGTLLPAKDRPTLPWLMETKYNMSKVKESVATSAVLDLGGASTQIAFEIIENATNSTRDRSQRHSSTHTEEDARSIDFNDIRSDDILPDPSIINVKLYDKNYSVKALSNLCFGMDQARVRHHFMLLQETATSSSNQIDPSVTMTDPCMPTNSRFSISGDKLTPNPCLDASLNWRWKSVDASKTYNFIGSSDDSKCQKRINDMLDWSTCNNKFRTCFRFDPSKSQVTSSKKIIAISGFYYSASILPLNDDSSISQALFESEAVRLCNSDLNDVLSFSPKVEKDYAKEYCFKVKFVDRLLTHTYRIHGEKFSDIVFTNKINQKSFGWTLGLMINATNILASGTTETSMISAVVFILICVNAIIVILLAFGLLYKAMKEMKKQQNQYSNRVSPDMQSQEKGGINLKDINEPLKEDPHETSPSPTSQSSRSPLDQSHSSSVKGEDVVWR